MKNVNSEKFIMIFGNKVFLVDEKEKTITQFCLIDSREGEYKGLQVKEARNFVTWEQIKQSYVGYKLKEFKPGNKIGIREKGFIETDL